MSNAIVLDTYDYAQALKKANVSEAQIEVQVARDKEMTKAINELISNDLATKRDLKEVETSIKQDINYLKKDIEWIKVFGYFLCGLIVLGFSILGFLIKH